MPSPDVIDERFDEIVRELRTLPGAPERLRDRVRELAADEPASREASSGWVPKWLTFRNVGWTVATAGAGFVAVALAYGVITGIKPGGDEAADSLSAAPIPAQATTAQRRDLPSPPSPSPSLNEGEAARSTAPSGAQLAAPATSEDRDATTLPPGQRLAHHTATMRLRVSDVDELSRTTREAMRIARRLGGFVASVNYAKPKGDDGDASLTLRVPTGKIQEAIAQLSDLGVIVSQRIEIQDVQNQVNDVTEQIASLRRTIRRIEARLKQSISEDERFRLQLQLEQARSNLRGLVDQRSSTVRRARLAVISVALTTREDEQKVAPPPGRVERAARNAATVLAKEVAAVVYVLIVISPLILLGAAAIVASRTRRRRFDERLLEQA